MIVQIKSRCRPVFPVVKASVSNDEGHSNDPRKPRGGREERGKIREYPSPCSTPIPTMGTTPTEERNPNRMKSMDIVSITSVKRQPEQKNEAYSGHGPSRRGCCKNNNKRKIQAQTEREALARVASGSERAGSSAICPWRVSEHDLHHECQRLSLCPFHASQPHFEHS